MFRIILFSCIFMLLSNTYCTSSKKMKTQFITSNKETVIESEGVRFKGLRDSKPAPSPSPNIHKLINKNKPEDKFECYDLNEMWKTDQFLGKWENEAGSISVYKVKFPVPEGIAIHLGRFVMKQDYEKWIEKNKNAADNIDVNGWTDFFSGGKLNKEPEIFKTSLVLKILHYKTVFDGGKNQDLYMVSDLRSAEPRAYLFVYETEPTTDIKQAGGAIQQSIQSLGFQTVRETEAKQMVTKASANNKNKQEYSEEYYVDRQRILNNIKNLKGWWFLETPNYIIISSIKDKKLISDIEKNIEKARNAYKLIFPVKKPISEVSVVKAFADRDEYLSYLGRNSEMAWSAGFWDFSKKELAISPIEGNVRSQDANKRFQDIMFHEGFHQYIYYASNGQMTAPWFNEGCATFFEGLKMMHGKENTFEIEPSQFLEPFQELAKRRQINVEDLLNIKSYENFYDKNFVENNYLMAWGLMYFLMKGSAVLKNKNDYSEIPSKYYEAILETGNADQATETAWKGVDMKKFNADFNAFWNSPPMISRSKTINPFEKSKKKPE